jgi:hypothetical protein
MIKLIDLDHLGKIILSQEATQELKSSKYENRNQDLDFYFEFAILQTHPKRARTDLLIQGRRKFIQIKSALESLIAHKHIVAELASYLRVEYMR